MPYSSASGAVPSLGERASPHEGHPEHAVVGVAALLDELVLVAVVIKCHGGSSKLQKRHPRDCRDGAAQK